MTDHVQALSALADWTLLAGSHEFPGPDGGTCINEAALVVAGFAYRSVGSADDMPLCFSRPIAAYALALQDGMPCDERQRLKPYVVRLAGTADTLEVEWRRGRYVAVQTVRRILPIALAAAGLCEHADRCAAAADVAQAHAAAKAALEALPKPLEAPSNDWEAFLEARASTSQAYVAPTAAVAMAAQRATLAAAAALVGAPSATLAATAALSAAAAVALVGASRSAIWTIAIEAEAPRRYCDRTASRSAIWTIAIEILDGMLAIGKQAEPIPVALIASRVEAVRAAARAREAAL